MAGNYCKLGSRRQLDYQLNTDGPEVLGNLNRLAGTAQDSRPSRPVNQTLEYFLEKIGNAPIAGLRQRMVQRLIRMKSLDAARLQGRFLVLIDGSGYLVSLFRCFAGLLHHHRKSMNIKELRIRTWVNASDCPARSYAQSVAPVP